MKIALVTRRYPPLIGGAERVLSYLAPALAAQGVEVTVLTSQVGGSPAVEELGSFRVERLPTSRLKFVGTFLYMRELSRWFYRNRVDLAYVSMLKHDAYVVVGQGRKQGFPVVLRSEGAGLTGDIAWQSWGRFGQTIARRCRLADAFVAISPGVRTELRGIGYDAAKVFDLPNGVPVPDVPWKPLEDSQIHAAFVGRLAPEKGLDTLVDAWAVVARDQPRARLTLVGEGPQRALLEAQIARLGLQDSITMPGALADPSTLLRASNLFVLPSREEGMSIALLEAMALALPCVASRIPGNAALIDDGVHGRLFSANDPLAMARAILDHQADLHGPAMAQAARARVIERYSIAAVAQRHVELFERLVVRDARRR